MSKDKLNQLRRIWNRVTAVLTVITAICLILACLQIYQSGDRPFTRDSIGTALSQLRVPGVLCLIAVIGGIILHAVSPAAASENKALRDEREILYRLQRKQGISDEARSKAAKEQRFRKIYRIAAAALICLLAVYPVIYFLNLSNFTIENLTHDILRGILTSMIPAVIALGVVFLCAKLENASIRREIEIFKSQPGKTQTPPAPVRNKTRLRIVRIGIFSVAVLFIILGISNGGIAAVLGKAIRICTECIGLG